MEAKIYNFHGWISETDQIRLYSEFSNALVDCGFHVLKEVEYFFQPYGYTALFLLGESHFAIHTFPEHNKTYIELSSCVKKQFDLFVQKYQPLLIQ